MSRVGRLLYLFVGALGAVASAWALTALAKAPADSSMLGIPMPYVLGVVGSICASAVFFIITELLRWWADSSQNSISTQFDALTRGMGLRHIYRQKGGDDAKKSYASAIAGAKFRVWAFGLSNGEFIKEHGRILGDKLAKDPRFDVTICFPDPDTAVTFRQESGSESATSFPDLFKIAQGKAQVGAAEEIRETIAELHATFQSVRAPKLRFVSVPGYISGMVVDDAVYAFPYTAHGHDNTTTPYVELHSSGLLGDSLLSYFEFIANHKILSRPAE